MPPQESEYFESEISGNFQGVGMEIGVRDDVITIIAPLRGTPAEKAGIKSGDKILKIDDQDTAKISSDQAARLIRGPKGTEVTLTIHRRALRVCLR
jgi:carboxyl-terminal processing protease